MAVWLTMGITQQSQNIEGNYTTAKVSVTAHWNWGSWAHHSTSGAVNFNGVNHSFTVWKLNPNRVDDGQQVIAEITQNIGHNNDGTGSASASAYYETGTGSNTVYGSTSTTFSTIPRASTLSTDFSSQDIGENVTITVNRASTSFTHSITYSCGGEEGYVDMSPQDTVIYWKIPESLYDNLATSTSKTLTLTCHTHNIGVTSKNITVTVPSNIVPEINNPIITQTTKSIEDKFGMLIQGKSVIKIEHSGIAGVGSSISKWQTELNGLVYKGETVEAIPITKSGQQSFKVTLTDSRGRSSFRPQPQSGDRYTTLYVASYQTPKITGFNAYRCDEDGSPDDRGTKVKLVGTCSIHDIKGIGPFTPTSKNTKQIRIGYRTTPDGTLHYTAIETLESYTVDLDRVLGWEFSIANTFEIVVEVLDFFNPQSKPIRYASKIPLGYTILSLHPDGQGVADGGVSVEDGWVHHMKHDFRDDVIFNDDIKLNPEGTAIEGLGNFSNMPLVVGGPIVESGNNANGDWIRYADGTQICYKHTVSTAEATNAYGSLYFSYFIGWTFPRQFTRKPLAGAFLEDNQMVSAALYNVGTGIIERLNVYTSVPISQTISVHYIAIGRWK